MGLSLHLGNQCEEEGGKHPEKICGTGHENGGTLLFIQKGMCIFPLDNVYKNIRYLILEAQVSNAPEVVQIPFYLFISGEA